MCAQRLISIVILKWGGIGGGETPLPIPNREVKPSSADGTARETVWESRSPPGVNEALRSKERRAFCFGVDFPGPLCDYIVT